MKRLAVWLAFLGVSLGAQAQAPDSEFLDIYRVIQEGEALENSGQSGPAMDRYREARTLLEQFARNHPNWNRTIVGFRQRYLAEKASSLAPVPVPTPAVSAPPAPSTVPPASPVDRPPTHVPSAETSAAPGPALTPALTSDVAVLASELSVARKRMNDAEARASAFKSSEEAAQRRADEAVFRAQQAEDRSSRMALDLRQVRDRVDVLEAAQRNLERLRDQLESERSTLQAKLREALSPKPASIDPIELARAEERNRILMKENAILQAGLDRQIAENSQILQVAQTATDLERELAAVRAELASQKLQNEQLHARWKESQAGKAAAENREAMVLRGEIESLRKELAAAQAVSRETPEDSGGNLTTLQAELAQQKMLAAELWRENSSLLRELQMVSPIRITPASLKVAEVPSGDGMSLDAARLQRLDRERHELRIQLDAARNELRRRDPAALESRNRLLIQQIETLQARVDVLQANPEPYTPEELALFRAPPPTASSAPVLLLAQASSSNAPTAAPAAPAPVNPPAASTTTSTTGSSTSRRRTEKDLPAGSGILAERALRAFTQRRFGEAETAYREILKLDESNVYTLGNLAILVVEQGRLDEGEQYIQRALKEDPQDPFSLFVLGNIRWRQNKLNEAFDLLSRSAKLDPDNPETHVFLGITLSGLGQRTAAEAALRKAVTLNPNLGMAHYNLAVLYARQNPPFLEMARFHYDKARRAGEPAVPAFEAILRGGDSAASPAAPATPAATDKRP